jgi:hypothetical protein
MSKRTEFELLEAHLTLQLKKHVEAKTTGKPSKKGSKVARDFIQVSMLCGKWSLDGMHYIPLVVDVEAIDNAIAEMEAKKAARALGYQDRDIKVEGFVKVSK